MPNFTYLSNRIDTWLCVKRNLSCCSFCSSPVWLIFSGNESVENKALEFFKRKNVKSPNLNLQNYIYCMGHFRRKNWDRNIILWRISTTVKFGILSTRDDGIHQEMLRRYLKRFKIFNSKCFIKYVYSRL